MASAPSRAEARARVLAARAERAAARDEARALARVAAVRAGAGARRWCARECGARARAALGALASGPAGDAEAGRTRLCEAELARPWLALRRLDATAHRALAADALAALASALGDGRYGPARGGAQVPHNGFEVQAPALVEVATAMLAAGEDGELQRPAARFLITLTDARQWGGDGGDSIDAAEERLLEYVGARSSVARSARTAFVGACQRDGETQAQAQAAVRQLRLLTLCGVALRPATALVERRPAAAAAAARRAAGAFLLAVGPRHFSRAPASVLGALGAPAAFRALAAAAPAAAREAAAAGRSSPSAALRAAASLTHLLSRSGAGGRSQQPREEHLRACLRPLAALLGAALVELAVPAADADHRRSAPDQQAQWVDDAMQALVDTFATHAVVEAAFTSDAMDACALYDALLALLESLPADADGAAPASGAWVQRLAVALAFSRTCVRASWATVCSTLATSEEQPPLSARELEALGGGRGSAAMRGADAKRAAAAAAAAKKLTPSAARGGFAAMAAAGAGAAMAVFCRAFSALLTVLEDAELNGTKAGCPLSPDGVRACAAMLNTAVYYSVVTRQTVATGGSGGDAALLRAGALTLRHLRTAACRSERLRASAGALGPPLLWTAPAVLAPPEAYGEWAEDAVLSTLPHVLPFQRRVAALRRFIDQDRRACGAPSPDRTDEQPGALHRAAVSYEVRRARLVEDGLQAFRLLAQSRAVLPAAAHAPTAGLRNPLHIAFVNAAGAREAGLDFGGLYKEFLTDMAAALCREGHYGLWSKTEDGLVYPSTESVGGGDKRADSETLLLYELAGQVLAKCLYEGVLVDAAVAPTFAAQILQGDSHVGLEDLAAMDKEIYASLMQVKHDDGDVADLCLDFTVEVERFGARQTHELVPKGGDVDVTADNKLLYVHKLADYYLNRATHRQRAAFKRGLLSLMRPSWLNMFSPGEFNLLTGGAVVDVSVDDLMKHTVLSGYSATSRTVKMFWRVVRGMSREDRSLLLKFVTSSSRPPALGFGHLRPPFTLHKVACEASPFAVIGLGKDAERLPSASTCFNTLKLPNFKKESTMRSKLLASIRSGAGFDLS